MIQVSGLDLLTITTTPKSYPNIRKDMKSCRFVDKKFFAPIIEHDNVYVGFGFRV